MRKITFARNMSSEECFKKVSIFVEDGLCGSEMVGGVPCRRLGSLKNGEQLCCELGEDALRIFALTDGVEPELCTEGFRLDAGDRDLVLSGECCENLQKSGNFRFGEAKPMRKSLKISKKLIAVLSALLVTCGIAFALALALAPEKVSFSVEEMTITLTEDFKQYNEEGFIATFRSSKVWVFATRNSFDEYPEGKELSEEEFAERIKAQNGNEAEIKQTRRGIYYLVYEGEHPVNHVKYQYYGFVYKSDDALWFLQFGTTEEFFTRYKNKFVRWANSVEFD